MAFLVALLVIVPLVEIAVLIQVGSWMGVLNTIALLVTISVLGAWLVKRQGIGLARRVQLELQAGRMPAGALLDGFLLLVAGVLLVIPGFVTDAIGLLLLLPPSRALARWILRWRWERGLGRWVVRRSGGRGPYGGSGPYGGPGGAGGPGKPGGGGGGPELTR
jgi:UPF0716 protein FxsA